MEYSKIVSVSGLPGLFELISSKADGAIVRSLDDKSTRFASSRIHNFSHLESIEVYTVNQNVNLVEVFHAMESGGSLPDMKDNAVVKKYFEKVYPDMDFERVYNSDLKKMVKWYEVLKNNNIEIKITEPEEEVEPEIEEKEETKEEKPKKEISKSKTAKEKKSSDKKETEKSSPKKDIPAKKAAKKKGK